MNEPARIVFNSQGNSFEIAGSEQFVSTQVDSFRELILKSLAQQPAAMISTPSVVQQKDVQSEDSGNDFTNLLHVDNDEVRIIKTVRGSSLADKTLKVAMIYLLAKHNSGTQEVSGDEIRKVCKDQGCLDNGNFAKTLASAKQYILSSGKPGGKKSYRLTNPGRDHAKALSAEENGS